MPAELRLAFVGCGKVAPFHLEGVKERGEGIRITAAIDPDLDRAQKIAAETGAAVFSSLEEGLAHGDFDAVDLMLPHDLHESAAIAAFAARKHVLLEKPMAASLEACRRIMAAAKNAGTVFMVAENSQYWPEIVKAQELIQSGAIGDVITSRAEFVVELDAYWFSDDKPWRYDKQRTGGGIVIDGGSHWIRPLRMWMGEIDEVIAVLDEPVAKMEGESLAYALFRMRSGKVASFSAMMLDTVMGPGPWWRIIGTGGEIVIDGHVGPGSSGGIRLFDSDNRDGMVPMPPQGYGRSFGPELADFAQAVLNGKPLAAGPEWSLGELRTTLAIYRSAASRQWEKVWD